MVTDRSTTAGLLCYLCVIYPALTLFFQLLTALDLSSHYMHMYSSLLGGFSSHKDVGGDCNWLLRIYYTKRAAMFVACGFNELFFMTLYTLHHLPGPLGITKTTNTL
jgi:CDP-diacylglycerol--inositol 3-phosphatidyltransferase